MLACCTNHFSNADIYFFSTHCILGWWGCFIACQYPNFSSLLHFFNMCQWEFNIIIIFNTIALALRMSRVRLTNQFPILKPLVFDSTGKLYDDKHLPQNHCFLLPLGLPSFRNGLLHPSHPFHFLHPSYLSHHLYLSDLPHIVLSHSWDQRVQYHGVYIPRSLEFLALALIIWPRYLHPSDPPSPPKDSMKRL